MKKSSPLSFEFLYQVFSLIISIILVHAIYVGIIWPAADAFLAEQAALMQQDPSYVAKQSVFVILRDYEQEACFILMLWALSIMIYKGIIISRNRSLLQEDLVPMAEGMKILPEDVHDISRQIQSLPPVQKGALLSRVLLAALQRFSSTRNIQDVSDATTAYCASEGDRLDSELSMIRYVLWAIPSIGFLGTVRGISLALGYAHRAVEGDIFDVTKSLGTAFNSTLIALLISLVLMFFLHQLQLMQERYVLDTETYCEEKLISRLHAR
jgi:biopolymer transport protein ExbB/TolQ